MGKCDSMDNVVACNGTGWAGMLICWHAAQKMLSGAWHACLDVKLCFDPHCIIRLWDACNSCCYLQYILWVLVIGPWKFIRGLSYVLNKWQMLFRPVSGGAYYLYDGMDKHMPTVRGQQCQDVFTQHDILWKEFWIHDGVVFTCLQLDLALARDGIFPQYHVTV